MRCNPGVRVPEALKLLPIPSGKDLQDQKEQKAVEVADAINAQLKKKYLAIGLLATSFSAYNQSKDSTYSRKKIRQTDIQTAFSFYTQDNDHSAITGGKGTENLQVYATQFSLDIVTDSVKQFHLDGGVDVISSASTDNIDFIVSSASKVDARTHIQAGYEKTNKSGLALGGKTSFSIESDYTSWGAEIHVAHKDPSLSRQWAVAFQLFLDDLRWGRLEAGKPQYLIYPQELRNTNWFDRYRRNSFNLTFDILQTINQRMNLGIYPAITYQHGLLSTPYNRVYFSDDSEKVENLPVNRWKFPVGIQLNSFVGSRLVLRAYYRFYGDSFGLIAHTFSIEGPVKLSTQFSLTPFIRVYKQKGTRYFHPYGEHDPEARYYTSDYDLSDFVSVSTGLGMRLAPYALKKSHTIRGIEIRYAFYTRNDGMRSHMISSFFDLSFP